MSTAWRYRVRARGALLSGLAIVLHPAALAAHDGEPIQPHDLWTAWSLEPVVLLSLALTAAVYGIGLHRLWRSGGRGAGVPVWRAAAFASGWLAMFVALVSPLDPLGEALFSAHMVQHTMLMLVAAPLLVLGAPLPVFMWGLPAAWRNAVAQALRGGAPLARLSQLSARPFLLWTSASAALWAWHIPQLYDAAVAHDGLHALEHACFVVTSLFFWWGLVDRRGALRRAPGFGIIYIFTMAMQSVALGALLTLSEQVWYGAHLETTAPWGFTPLQDQQIAGAVMWMPAGSAYLFAMLALVWTWLHSAEEQSARREARTASATLGLLLLTGLAACADPRDPLLEHGREAIDRYGCGSCHIIPGVRTPQGLTGPPLDHFGARAYIAGALSNTPTNLVRWIMNPQAIEPGTVMPDLGVTEEDAGAIAAYLHSLR